MELRTSLPLGNGLSRMTVVDNNRDGKVDMAYAEDLAGNVACGPVRRQRQRLGGAAIFHGTR